VLPVLSHEQLRQFFPAEALELAAGDVRNGAVRVLHAMPGQRVEATVDDGTGACTVRVLCRVSSRRVLFEAHCTCTQGQGCRHVAAVLLACCSPAITLPAGAVPDPAPAADAACAPWLPPTAGVALPRADAAPAPAVPVDSRDGGFHPLELDRWLAITERALAPAAVRTQYPPGVSQRLLYVLRFPLASAALAEVRLMQARARKGGGIGQPQPWRNAREAANNPPRFVLDEDRRLLRRLLVETRDTLDGYALEGDSGASVLQDLLATGRCYAECSLRGRELKLLRPGPRRPGRAAWRFRGNGTQDIACETEPPSDRVLGLAPPYYVDTSSGDCGPVETGLPPDLAAALLQAPSVAPAQVATVRAELKARLGARAGMLPQPGDVQVEHRRDIAPQPVLRLWTQPAGRFGPVDDSEDLAALHIEYAGERARLHEPGALRVFRAGRLLHVVRDHHAERQALERLEAAGLVPVPRSHALGPTARVFTLRSGRWLDFMREQVPALRAAGFRIDVDAGFRFNVVEGAQWYVDLRPAGADWFSIGIGVEVGDTRVELLPILATLLSGQRRLRTQIASGDSEGALQVRLDDGRLLSVPFHRLRSIVRILDDLLDTGDGPPRVSRFDASRLRDVEQEGTWTWHGGEALRELGRRLADAGQVADVPAPAGLRATLRPYQARGLAWMQFLRACDLHGVLADDMGLGKTVQALAHILAEKEAGRLLQPALVVSPTSVLPNWRAEAARFAPDLRVLVSHGVDRHRGFGRMAAHDVVLTTYPLLVRDRAELAAQPFHLAILDEAQQIKNAQSQAAAAATALVARHRLCLTGTPIENNLGELWSQFRFLMPGFLGDAKTFRRTYRTPIEKHGDQVRRAGLARRLRPFILRRTKADVEPDLPPRTEVVHAVELGRAQRDLYETVRVAMHERVRREIAERGVAGSRIVVLDALLKLRQICCDPRLLKLDAARGVTESAKLAELMAMLESLLADGRRVLLFSQFTSMLALIRAALEARHIGCVELTGDTRDRAEPVRAFQAGEVPLFLISLKAGGTGLNLTAADTVIHYDPWWNPAVENQATDRAHRIGQDKPVFVYRLIVAGSVEERIGALQAAKSALAAAVLDGEAAGAMPLTADDIAALFEPLR
jgi:superfamily II DNA or RNA helicase